MTPNGRTLLHSAACGGRFEVFKLISDNTEDNNPIARNGYTPLHVAAWKGHLRICKYIIGKVVDKKLAINFKDKFNFTPLEYAEGFHHQHVVDYMKSVTEN